MSSTVLAKPSPPVEPGAPKAGRKRKGGAGRTLARSAPLIPSMVLLAVFLLAPVVSSFYGSFTDSALTGSAAKGATFIGLQNYFHLFSDPDFLQSIWLTVVFLIGSAIIGQNVLGYGLAMLMQSGNRIIRGVVGTLVVTSWVLPEIVAAFAAYAFFHADGTLDSILRLVGLTGPNWLYSFPMLAVILANIWRGTAFSMLVYTAALADVPEDVQESAAMDGASGVKRLRYITLQTLSAFTIIYVMTGGGPGTKSSTLPILAYQEAFKFSEIGLGTAIATILLLVGAVFSVIYIRALRPEVD